MPRVPPIPTAYAPKVLDGLRFLHGTGLGYGKLRSANILINDFGHVKLSKQPHGSRWPERQMLTYTANQEKLRSLKLAPKLEQEDIAAVGVIARNLMQKDDGPQVTDSDQWAPFLGFVADAASVRHVVELRQVSQLHAWGAPI